MQDLAELKNGNEKMDSPRFERQRGSRTAGEAGAREARAAGEVRGGGVRDLS